VDHTPLHQFEVEESIYDMSFLLGLKPDILVKTLETEEDSPQFNLIQLNFNLMKIYKATMFCFFSQVGFSALLLVLFSGNKDKYVVGWKILIARFMASSLIHWQFATKVTHSLDMMKYVGKHADRFTFPRFSMMIAFG
jgi:hypothetical protein